MKKRVFSYRNSFIYSSSVDFSSKVIKLIKSIPKGKVATYSQIACLAGFCSSIRRVVWILHACSKKEGLPWHRVVNQKGTISLRPGAGYETQKELLQREGIVFDKKNRINMERYLWEPDEDNLIEK
jgi:methylated-DNA-protein-cysteine methyltransferase-like protein